MDLRSIMNEGGGGAPRPPSQPVVSARPPSQGRATAAPATPVQTHPSQGFRDYSQSSQASPGGPQREYSHPGAPPPGQPLYGSPTSYQNPTYAGRPAPPPLQPPGPNDVRSPGSAAMSGPSPYRHTPTSSLSAQSGGAYPFPPSAQPPASPVQRQQYPPTSAYPRDSFSQPSAAIPQAPGPYLPQQQVPQTPHVGTPSNTNQFIHQRSQSMQSATTPNSAQPQPHPHGYAQPPYGSPVATHHPPPPFDHQRQGSQPPTPLGPPMMTPSRQSSGPYAQPQSPYQHRVSSSANSIHLPSHAQPSPPQPPPPSIPRQLSNHSSTYEQQVNEAHRRSTSRSERDHSMSVSPKTRVPSLPSSAGQRALSIAESEPHHAPPPPPNHVYATDVTPAKRKLEDRDLPLQELENQQRRPPPAEVNGGQLPFNSALRASMSPAVSRKKRTIYSNPPVWAQSGRGKQLGKSQNFNIRKPAAASPVNGKPASIKSEHASRHASPEAARAAQPASTQPAPVQTNPTPAPETKELPSMFEGRPFPWEPSIENKKPYEIATKSVADFIYLTIVPGSKSLTPGVQFEIEAKLGTIIDKSTNDRVFFPIVAGECIMHEGARVAFKSSMTEFQHRKLNEYLNQEVIKADPRNTNRPPGAPPRVRIEYKHRREIDRFYELPPQMLSRLPPYVAALLTEKRSQDNVKVRVTYDQKTNNVLAKIVKARVADIHIHMPHMPVDCRVSINIEAEWDGPVEEIEHLQIKNKAPIPDRNKDRLSYTHGFYQVDLTQVTQTLQMAGGQQRLEKEHELEVEIDSAVLLEHAKRLQVVGAATRWSDLVDGLMDNVRALARKVEVQQEQ